MSHPVLYLAITNHGYGHATRAASVAAAIAQLDPNITLILATTAQRSILDAYLPGDWIHHDRGLDCGVIQADSMTMDLRATLEQLQAIRRASAVTIASEARWLKQQGVGLVLGDIPPLAAPIAHAAGVPCWMMGNFGWDFIYEAWVGEYPAFQVEVDWIRACFGQCDRLFKMPFSEPMTTFGNVTNVGLTGVSPRFDESVMRSNFDLGDIPREKIIMLTFGGLGLNRIPYENVLKFPDCRFICFDLTAPELPNLIRVDDRFYRPIDFAPLLGRLISKPGYSTFSEACRYDVPLVSLTRDGFAEAPILVAGIQDCAVNQVVETEDFFNGGWEFLHQPMLPPRTATKLAKDGTETIARAVFDYFATAQDREIASQ